MLFSIIEYYVPGELEGFLEADAADANQCG